jgi:Flp pilus assembly protein CpaB
MPDVVVAADRPDTGPTPRGGDASAGNGTGGARRITRRGGLPTGRAVLGGFLVAASALGVYAAHQQATQGPTTAYVVARRDLPVGTRLTADDLTALPMELPEVVAHHAAFTAEGPLVGATTVGPIRRGELVQAGDVVQRKAGTPTDLELSFEIDRSHALAGTLRSGERVDVLATFGAGGDTYTVTVVRGALVLDAGQGRSALGAADDSLTVTVAVPTADDALAITHAVNAGEVNLVRTAGTAPGPAGQTYRAPAAGSER